MSAHYRSPVLDYIAWEEIPLHRQKVECQWVWAAAAVAVAVIGIGISTYAASEQAASSRKAAELQSDFRMQEAESARQAAAFEERQFRRRAAILLGKSSAVTAATGLDPTEGSPLLAELDNTRQTELNALNIRRGGDVNAAAKSFEARLERIRASQFGQQQSLAIAGGATKAGGTILSSWARYKLASPDPYAGMEPS